MSIVKKKVSELNAVTTAASAYQLPIHDGTGLKRITAANFQATPTEQVNLTDQNDTSSTVKFYCKGGKLYYSDGT